jgi:RimJ/RimL family protein N-acetyltransferase
MSEINEHLSFRPVRIQDLELLISWRSNPEIYRQFKHQNSALDWQEHVAWFASRSDDRYDYIIEYKGRRVGSVYIDENKMVGVYVGETSLQGKGIGTQSISWITEKFTPPLYAEIRENNKASRAVFEKCGFVEDSRKNNWVMYKFDKK